MKRICLILLAAVLVLSLCACGSEDDTKDNQTETEQSTALVDEQDNTFTFRELTSNTVAVSGYKPSYAYEPTDLVIPAKLGEKTVTAIDAGVFKDRNVLVSVTIPAGVTEIGNNAFANCEYLKTVVFAEGSKLASIGEGAFLGCSALQSISFPEDLTVIGKGGFWECTSLATVAFAGTALRTLEAGAFYGCTVLTAITLPEGLETVGDQAFYGCSKLASAILPASVTTLGKNVFAHTLVEN